MFPSILIVDDEPFILKSLEGLLADEGFETITARNGYEALKIISSESPDLVLLDIWMPGIDGIETLKEIKKDHPFIPVIIITGHGNIETAVKATKLGAFDLIEKPLSFDKVIVAINNALNFRRLEEENRYLRKKTLEKHSITGNSPPIGMLKKQIAVAAPADKGILLLGENGTGKELVARTIHQLSPRAQHPMITVNCATIPEELIESELFGHEKGAFAEATGKKRGEFELADKGTVFLDEIGDMSLKTQSKVLRFLEEQSFQRVGGNRTLEVNVRIIAATNKNLELAIAEGRFREDLYYRLNVIPIQVPALRERVEDIPLLVETFLTEIAAKNAASKKKIAREPLSLLAQYPWPGNVRELKNLVERLHIMVDGDTIEAKDLPEPYSPGSCQLRSPLESGLFATDDLGRATKSFEKEFILHKLTIHDNDLDQTAAALGVSRSHLERILTP